MTTSTTEATEISEFMSEVTENFEYERLYVLGYSQV